MSTGCRNLHAHKGIRAWNSGASVQRTWRAWEHLCSASTEHWGNCLCQGLNFSQSSQGSVLLFFFFLLMTTRRYCFARSGWPPMYNQHEKCVAASSLPAAHGSYQHERGSVMPLMIGYSYFSIRFKKYQRLGSCTSFGINGVQGMRRCTNAIVWDVSWYWLHLIILTHKNTLIL